MTSNHFFRVLEVIKNVWSVDSREPKTAKKKRKKRKPSDVFSWLRDKF